MYCSRFKVRVVLWSKTAIVAEARLQFKGTITSVQKRYPTLVTQADLILQNDENLMY